MNHIKKRAGGRKVSTYYTKSRYGGKVQEYKDARDMIILIILLLIIAFFFVCLLL
ncbi:hypothetical protein [uncultured Flavobacterium sp.]|jgi:hypothetical protein|uniref:hypothetical protein n=1 Tax=uncultured Flavobacterium sp. TaxID=165435 RepID=UPI0025F88BC8|nr:hypothetical protein [uncultured Flavobacterium sp.]